MLLFSSLWDVLGGRDPEVWDFVENCESSNLKTDWGLGIESSGKLRETQ